MKFALRQSQCGTLREWIEARVREEDRGHSSPCWIWQMALCPRGYGRTILQRNGKVGRHAHRIAYEAFKGPIPAGLQIDHLCSVRACCNPEHLEAVTPEENRRRSIPTIIAKARQRFKSHCKRGHPLSGDNLAISYLGQRMCRACRRHHHALEKAKRRASGPKAQAGITPPFSACAGGAVQ